MSKQMTTMTQLAGEMEVDAKTIRAALRKAGWKRPGKRWVFDAADKAKVKSLMKSGAKKEAVKRGRPRKVTGSDASHALHS
jgi:hypothetical protein